jgi:hypothetical protein
MIQISNGKGARTSRTPSPRSPASPIPETRRAENPPARAVGSAVPGQFELRDLGGHPATLGAPGHRRLGRLHRRAHLGFPLKPPAVSAVATLGDLLVAQLFGR